MDGGSGGLYYPTLRGAFHMSRRALSVVVASIAISVPIIAQRSTPAPQAARASAAAYFPERFDWQHKKPEEVGMNPTLVNEAVQAAIAADTPGPKDMTLFLQKSFGKEPY